MVERDGRLIARWWRVHRNCTHVMADAFPGQARCEQVAPFLLPGGIASFPGVPSRQRKWCPGLSDWSPGASRTLFPAYQVHRMPREAAPGANKGHGGSSQSHQPPYVLRAQLVPPGARANADEARLASTS